ncbi:glutamate [NMDA] receptor subunit 1 isoform X2 [Folsomia candida]|uniref:glutamate [NMDA] receptor subunit 1 isoform X2 n=1 Tax=Folsomia candida TaxID=158441 RepID=UPI00160525AC|nr:glutamate [NMDA] receptor subunit 1 isoform X2 [Folsomia candida]
MRRFSVINCLLIFWLFLLLYIGVASETNLFHNNHHNNSNFSNPDVYQIGGVLSSEESLANFTSIIQLLNFDQQYVPRGKTLVATSIKMETNPIRTAIRVCDGLIKQQVYAVVVSHSPKVDLSPAAVSYTSGFYHIPVIGISSRDSAFSDKNIHVSFLRTVPPYSHQADVWVEMLKHFHYEKVIFLHSSDTDGRSILGRFQTNAQNLEDDIEIKIEMVIELEPGSRSDNYKAKLTELRNAQARVYLLYASNEDAHEIFDAASSLSLTDPGHVWFLTEQLLESPFIPQGSIGLKLVNAGNETAHIMDSLRVLAVSLKEMDKNEAIHEAPRECNTSGTTWETGKMLFEYIKKQEFLNGETGKVAFDESGDRMNAEYHVMNVHPGGKVARVGQYFYSSGKKQMDLKINDSAIVWPGGAHSKPVGFMIPTHLQVLTIEETPFVFVRRVESYTDCRSDEEPCPHFNTTETDYPVMYCCRGYCIDLLKQLKLKMNFTASLALSPDGQFGSCVQKNDTAKKEWTGLIGELVTERADMIVAPLTINPERAQVIEFSKPFKYQGITILVKRKEKKPTFGSFLQPFRGSLWILVMVSVHVVALALYLLDRFSPFGRYRLANMEGTEEDALNLSSAIWFAWGVLLNSGIGEGTPRSFAARVLGIVWAGFAMIIVASYTANLAAFLVLDRPKTIFSGIHDNRLRNPADNINYSTVKGSAVDMYFRRQVELSNMYRVMERRNYDTAQEAIDAVKASTLDAFIWDSSRLQYEAAQNCDLMTSGELFGRSGYAIGLQKGSPWANDVTLAILELSESGFMEELDKKWIINPELITSERSKICQTEEKIPTTLGLENMHDAFYLIAAGILGGLVLILIEIFYKKHQLKRQRQLEIARHAAEKWRNTCRQRKLDRSLERRFKENGPPPFWTPGLDVRQRSPIASKANTIFV